MADVIQKILPLRIELDNDESLRSAFNAAYILNLRSNLNLNANAAIDGNALNQGSNAGIITPVQSPEQICADIELPEGNNLCIGAFNSAATKEIYWANWNDEGNHNIWVYGTDSQECRKVYQGECLNFQFDPKHHLPAHRWALYVVYDADEDGNQTIKHKFLVFTDGFNWQFMIDVESAIATDSYNPTLYPYFKTFYPHCDPCEFIQLGIRPPRTCPVVLPFDDDTQLQFYENEPENNNLKEKVWYFATSFIDVFGRHSTMSPYSTAVFFDGGDCGIDAEDPKCFKLVLDAGSAIVDKIVVYFSNNAIDWFKYDEIEKWEDCPSPTPSPPQDDFWERELALKNYYEPSFSPDPCNPEGCFSTFQYTWDLDFSPPLEPESTSIVIDGQVYSSDSILGYHGLVLWLNSLGLGTFVLSIDLQLSTSSAEHVYGSITIGDSPVEADVDPRVDEVEQCGDANTFIYQFCGNKQCIPVAATEVVRYFDDLPIQSVALTTVDDKIALSNNLRNYDNFICPLDKIHVTAVQDDPICETELVTITIDAVIQNFYANKNQFIYEMEDSTDNAWGGVGDPQAFPGTVQYENEVRSSYKQYLATELRGFIGGLRGTTYKVVSQQYKTSDLETLVYPTGIGQNKETRDIMYAIEGSSYFFIQRFQFKVPKGNYIFEIYSHLSELSNCEGTSTYFFGVVNKNGYEPFQDFSVTQNIREIEIDACDGDFEYSRYVVIADLTKPKNDISVESDARAVAGYLRETETNIPIERGNLDIDESVELNSQGTDHNGFFFATDDDNFTIHLNVLSPDTCTLVEAHVGGTTIDGGQLLQADVFTDNPALANFNDCGHEIVTGTILDCDGNPISGIPVVLTQTGRYGVTDTDGVYTILAHDNANAFSQDGDTRKTENIDSLYIMQQGACLLSTDCAYCETCIPIEHVDWIQSCFDCTNMSPPTVGEPTYNFTFRVLQGAYTGLKTGGTYAVAISGYDYLGRNNAVQFITFITIPTIMATGIYAPYHLEFTIDADTEFADWVKEIRFLVRGNDEEFLLSWATNKVEFVDGNGNVTSSSVATNIRIYIDGLNNFNTQNFLNTNTTYQWVKGDRIRFITIDGENVLDSTDIGLIDLPVSGLENGNVLLIPYDSRLADLETGATFELYRVPICETEPVYWEQCPSIPVIENGDSPSLNQPTILSGTIPFFDTYYFFRAIPMTDQDDKPILYVSPHPYEHHSPSDFWGDHQFAIGRGFVRNENQRQTWYIDEDGWSDSLLEDGVINGLGTWRTENRKSYFTQGGGGIVATKAQYGLLMHVCEHNWFVVNIAQNLLIVNTEGNIQANPDYFGNRQQKIGNIYGCAYEDTGTIIFREQWISWADAARGAYCFSNYQTVWDITQPNEGISLGGMQSYWIEKLRKVASLRSENQFTDNFMYLHAGVNIKGNEIIVTSFARVGSPSIDYGTDALDYEIDANETVSYNLGGYWSGNYSPTPERWIEFESEVFGVQLISFVEGKMWMHNIVNPDTNSFNNFYGTQYGKVIKFVANGGEGKNFVQKLFLAMRSECKDEKFTSDQITSQTGQLSKIPAEAWERVSNYFEAPILMDENSEIFEGLSALLEGTNIFGNWIKIRLIGEVGSENDYCEITGFIISSIESY